MFKTMTYIIPDEIEYYTNEVFNEYGGLYRYGITGAGSCFYHAILCAVDLEFHTGWVSDYNTYRSMDTRSKLIHVNNFRLQLGSHFTKSYYDQYADGQPKELSNAGMVEYSYDKMYSDLIDPKCFFDERFHRFMVEFLDCNIYILTHHNRLYKGLYEIPNKPIILLYNPPEHFEIIATQQMIDDKDPFIFPYHTLQFLKQLD